MNKNDIIKSIINEYGVTSPNDITNALKDLLEEALQVMMDTEFDDLKVLMRNEERLANIMLGKVEDMEARKF